MMKSLYSGVAGLKVHNQRMDVIGNNISNVNTTGFKASTVTFKDIFYQDKSQSSSGTYAKGGKNANQVGYGASMGAIQQVMTQSGLTFSDNVTDCAIQGEGFFQVMDGAGQIYYTRNGSFHIDNAGNLCDPNGNIVLGISGDPTNTEAGSNPINLYVPPVENTRASADKVYTDGTTEYNYTISTSNFGDEGNISVTIRATADDEVPFATLNGRSLIIELDLTRNYQTQYEFQVAINEAIAAGGIELPNNMLPLNFEFMNAPTLPEDINSAKATSTFLKNETGTTQDDTYWKQLFPNLNFALREPGDFGNNYEINIVGYDARGNDKAEPTAKWTNNVLTVRVPSNTDVSVEALQNAINKAAGGNKWREIDVCPDVAEADRATTNIFSKLDLAVYDPNSTDPDLNTPPPYILNDAANADALGFVDTKTTFRLGFSEGRDNFYARVAESMGTVKLNGGAVAAEQTTKDLEAMYIDDDGVIYGVHAVHGTIAMGRIDLAVFENPMGLNQVGTSYWQPSLSSGDPEIKKANENGSGAIVSNALEMSNADLSQEISDMIITQRGFQANSRVITVTDTMLEELVNLKR